MGNVDLGGEQFYLELVRAKKDNTIESLEWLRRHLYFLDIHWDSRQ
jgi:hypothetical protein